MNLQSMKRQDVPLHAEVAAVLRHQILSGDLPSGTRLPALRELTERLGVARMTVVQAMNTLEDEGLIERHAGRGTFVREVDIPLRHTLQMKADLDQIHAMVEGLEVSALEGETVLETGQDGRRFRSMRRIHARDGKPFCRAEVRLDDEVFRRAPERFSGEIVVAVLRDIGVAVASARQRIAISYADFGLAQALEISVNSAVIRVYREFYDARGDLIYSAALTYPGDLLELEIEFAVNGADGESPAPGGERNSARLG